ncbi:MAG: pseudouridine-5'-phosphate glycosidase [Actinomycetes bacterium]
MLIHPEVAEALRDGLGVVALESTIYAHGLPRPHNLQVAREVEAVVRERGAVPATIAVLDGTVRVGLDDEALRAVCTREDLTKASVRDLAVVVGAGQSAATTVAATAHLAARAGIRVFATGGIGGVHRGSATTFDESADLTTLARTRILVVCAGVKSILDIPATLERLESLGVAVLGYRTDDLPAFYVTSSGLPVSARVDSPDQVARVLRAADHVGTDDRGVVLAQPLPLGDQLDPRVHDRVLADALAAAADVGVQGKDVTPFLLAYVHEHTGGRSVQVNTTIILRNAALAAEVAVAHASDLGAASR